MCWWIQWWGRIDIRTQRYASVNSAHRSSDCLPCERPDMLGSFFLLGHDLEPWETTDTGHRGIFFKAKAIPFQAAPIFLPCGTPVIALRYLWGCWEVWSQVRITHSLRNISSYKAKTETPGGGREMWQSTAWGVSRWHPIVALPTATKPPLGSYSTKANVNFVQTCEMKNIGESVKREHTETETSRQNN